MGELPTGMARKLAHETQPGRNGASGDETPENGGKGLLKRRGFLALGASAVAVALGTGANPASAVTENGTATLTTDFSEYAQ